jgi:hypothetical protein
VLNALEPLILAAARYVDPEKAKGKLPEGVTIFGERITEVFPEHGWSGERILDHHRQRNASRVPPPPRPGAFRTHSLRRI